MSHDSERELASRLERIEARLAALEARLGAAPRAEDGAVPAAPARVASRGAPDSSALLGLAGRSFLVLGGAFLVRALAQTGAVSAAAGVGLGALYVGAWLVAAHLAARRGGRASATAHGVCALAIGVPLVGEAVARFAVLSAAAGAALLVALAGGALAVAALHGLRLLAWCAALGGAGAALALLPSTHGLAAACATLIALALAAAALAHLGRAARGPRWALAPLADLTVLLAVVLMTRAGGPPAAYAAVGPRSILVAALVLATGQLALVAFGALVLRRDVGAFEIAQGVAAAAVGFAGAARMVFVLGSGAALLGLGSAAAGAASCVVAFAALDRAPELRRSFLLAIWLGLALAVGGSALLLPAAWRAGAWIALALVVAARGARRQRWTPSLQAALLVLAAAVAAGAPRALWQVFAASPETQPGVPAPPWLAAAAGALGVHFLLRRWAREERALRRPPVVLPAVVWLSAALVASAIALAAALGGAGAPARLALARTLALVVVAVALAAASAWPALAPVAKASPLLLALTAVKLVVEDLRLGDASEIFVGFGVFGAGLLAVARLARHRAATPAGGRETKRSGEGPSGELT